MSSLVEVVESTGRLAIDEPFEEILCTCGSVIARKNDTALLASYAPSVIDLKTGFTVKPVANGFIVKIPTKGLELKTLLFGVTTVGNLINGMTLKKAQTVQFGFGVVVFRHWSDI